MESYIADLANPNHEGEKNKQFPFAPWFDSAVLANQYFFVDKPDIEAEGLQKQPAHPPKKPLKKAMEQRAEWRKKLNLGDIQIALGTKHRAVLREKIKTTKQALVAVLDHTNPELERLVANLDDWFELPGEPQGPLLVPAYDKTPHYGDAFIVMDELIARLGDHEYKLDNHLETEPQTEAQLYALEQNDPGAKLLIDLLSTGHPLYARMSPPASECRADDETGNGETPQIANSDPYDPSFDASKLMAVARRTSQAISGWIDHYASVAASQYDVQKSIVGFLSDSKLTPQLQKVNMTMLDFLDKQAPDGYEFVFADLLESDKKIKRSDALNFDGGEIDLEAGKSAKVDLYTPDGNHFASTTLEAFKQGKGYSSRYWKKKRHHTKWLKQTVEVWVAKTIKGAPGVAKQFVESGAWTRTVLPVVVILEVWNLQGAVRAFIKSEGFSNREIVNLAGAITDTAAIAASINQARFELAHRTAEKTVGSQIAPGRDFVSARRWARRLGAGASAFSAGLSFYDMLRNVNEGDDAAIAHGVMASGFTLVAMSEVAGLAAAYGAGGTLVGILTGPVGWIGLVVVLAGAALLSWVFTEDSPLEEWLANGPFSHKPDLNLAHPRGRNRRNTKEHARYIADDGSQLYLDKGHSILSIGSINHSFIQEGDGAIYQAREGGGRVLIGRIGQPLDLDRLADRTNRFAGFSESETVDYKFHIWKVKPISAYQSLISAIYTPTATIELRQERIDRPWRVELAVHIPQYIDNASLLKIKMWQTNGSDVFEQVYDKMHLITSDGGSGPRTVMVVEPLKDQISGRVKAEITLDLYGTKQVVLPLPDPSWSDADEQRRQHLLTEKRIAPVGAVNVDGEDNQENQQVDSNPKIDAVEPLIVKAGPPIDYHSYGP
jgi:hypothetical protein